VCKFITRRPQLATRSVSLHQLTDMCVCARARPRGVELRTPSTPRLAVWLQRLVGLNSAVAQRSQMDTMYIHYQLKVPDVEAILYSSAFSASCVLPMQSIPHVVSVQNGAHIDLDQPVGLHGEWCIDAFIGVSWPNAAACIVGVESSDSVFQLSVGSVVVGK